jgi:hypothetical protein
MDLRKSGLGFCFFFCPTPPSPLPLIIIFGYGPKCSDKGLVDHFDPKRLKIRADLVKSPKFGAFISTHELWPNQTRGFGFLCIE